MGLMEGKMEDKGQTQLADETQKHAEHHRKHPVRGRQTRPCGVGQVRQVRQAVSCLLVAAKGCVFYQRELVSASQRVRTKMMLDLDVTEPVLKQREHVVSVYC